MKVTTDEALKWADDVLKLDVAHPERVPWANARHVLPVLTDEMRTLREIAEAASRLRAHVATLPVETQQLLNVTGWMTELRNALTKSGRP